ncbi:MAG: hypothetical protein ACMUIM_10325 [bacterium]
MKNGLGKKRGENGFNVEAPSRVRDVKGLIGGSGYPELRKETGLYTSYVL